MTEHRDAPPGGGQRSGRLGARAGLAAFGVLATLAALLTLEAVFRVVAPNYLAARRGPHAYSAALGWVSRGGVTLTLAGKRVTLNGKGHRGRELAARRNRNARLVVIGDSIAFGLGVADEETFSSLLDARDNGIEVANLAVQGYGPDQELVVLQRAGLPLGPDVVVVAFCMANDLAESMLRVSLYDGSTPKPRFHLTRGELVPEVEHLEHGLAWQAQRALADHSQLFNRLASLRPEPRALPGPHWRERYAAALRDEDQVVALNVALVRRMRDASLERGAGFLLAAFPDRSSFRAKPPLLQRFFDRLEDEGIPVLELAPRFRARGLKLRDVAIDPAGHLSPRGHSIVSDELEGAVKATLAAGTNDVSLAPPATAPLRARRR